MKKDTLLPLLKYYHEEKDPPPEFNRVQTLWWEGERTLVETISKDPSFFERLLEVYRKALKEKNISGKLADESIDERKRAIIFYLDIWHGRYFPHDSLDLIYQY